MILLIALCDLSWWQILFSWLLPFLLGWILSQIINGEKSIIQTSERNSVQDLFKPVEPKQNEAEIRRLNRINLEFESKLVESNKKNLALERSKFEMEMLLSENKMNNNRNEDSHYKKTENPSNKDLKLDDFSSIKHKDELIEFKSSVNAENKVGLDFEDTDKTNDENRVLETNYDLNIFNKLVSSNLQIFEGLGPKMESFLKSEGVNTWDQLSLQDAGILKIKLEKLDPKYRILEPDSWPIQAKMACEKKWNALIAYQKHLSAGKSKASTVVTDSKLEKILVKLGLLKKFDKDDLKAIEGIGPKIEKILMENGIDTWVKLSNADEDRIRAILGKAGDRFQLADPKTWPYQAGMADEGKWKELFAYQDTLKGGKLVDKNN
ncbi:MAG: helix-hairpin-helix domain-containing protein [Saprospiraceae bacterium]